MNAKVFLAELNNLYVMLDFIKDFGRLRNFSPSFLDRIVLAAEEALVNIITHGYLCDGKKNKKETIEIVCEDSAPLPGIKIIIKDKGIPFNPLETSSHSKALSLKNFDTNEAQSLLPVGGYGICMLIALMDKVEYQHLKGENVLSLTKYLVTN